jgi:hypothetical protein
MRPLNVLFFVCILVVVVLGQVTASFFLRPPYDLGTVSNYAHPVGAFLPVSTERPYWEFVNLSAQAVQIDGVPGDFPAGPEVHRIPWRAVEATGTVRSNGIDSEFPSAALRVAPVLIPYNDEPYCPICQKSSTTWTIPAGRYEITRTLVIPEGLRVTIAAGVQLNFAATAGWVARSPVTISGTAERPVVFQGGSGSLFLLRHGEHRLSYVRWRSASAPQFFGYALSGMANFVGGDVRGDHWELADAAAAEALSFHYGTFAVTDVTIARSPASAIGAHGSRGGITGLRVATAKRVLRKDEFSHVELAQLREEDVGP